MYIKSGIALIVHFMYCNLEMDCGLFDDRSNYKLFPLLTIAARSTIFFMFADIALPTISL